MSIKGYWIIRIINVLTSWSPFLMLLFLVISDFYCKLNEVCFVAWISLQPFLEVPGNTFAKPVLAVTCKAVWLWMGHRAVSKTLLSQDVCTSSRDLYANSEVCLLLVCHLGEIFRLKKNSFLQPAGQ